MKTENTKKSVQNNADCIDYLEVQKISNHKLTILQNNREQYIAEMLQMKRKKLEKNYDLILIQLNKAIQTNNHKAVEVLQEMESQVLEALVLLL